MSTDVDTAAQAKGPKISKGVIAQFLRTNCRRQLYLSIHAPLRDKPLYDQLGIPPAAKWRPGLVSLTRSGRNLEDERFDELSIAFPDCLTNFKTTQGHTKGRNTALREMLSLGVGVPHLLIEGEFQSSALTNTFYDAIGIAPEVACTLPRLADLRPDIILAVTPNSAFLSERRPRQVRRDGSTEAIPLDDQRTWLIPIDIKRSEALNASYAIEVALYSILLALWLEETGLSDRYLVIDKPALWMLDPPGAKPLEELRSIPTDLRIAALLQRVEVVEFDQYVVSMRKIFRDDVVAVTAVPKWSELEPHVGPYCGMCDFYANPDWAPKDKITGQKESVHPEHCSVKVRDLDHLSRIPDVSRGMARTLIDDHVHSVTLLAGRLPEDPVFGKHNRLAAERRLLPQRATHLLAGTRGPTGRQCATLPRYSHLSAYIFVNFDAATGFTTGFSVFGNYRPPSSRSRLRTLGRGVG